MKTIRITLALTTSALLISCASSTGIKPYTSDTCVITDNKLGSMGTPITKTYGNQEVKFCCRPCIAKFEKNPDKYLKKL
jgi:YHS domain-containing protein